MAEPALLGTLPLPSSVVPDTTEAVINQDRIQSSFSRSDLWHRTSKETVWLNNSGKPLSQLISFDAQFSCTTRILKQESGLCKDTWYQERSLVESLQKRCEEGELDEAVEALNVLVDRGCRVSVALFYRILKRCTTHKDLLLGTRVHALAVRNGYESNSFLANHLICMYTSLERLEEAMRVFSKVPAPNVYMWTSIILAHVRHGFPKEATSLYRQMRDSSARSDNHIFVAVLKACAAAGDLVFGEEVHADILRSGVKPDAFVGSSLVDMYAKCGSLDNAARVFEGLPTKSVGTWTALIAGYVQLGLGKQALDLYARMQLDGLALANRVTFVCLLQACGNMGALHQGKQLHAQIQEGAVAVDLMIGNCLVDMYSKCGSLDDARRVFDGLLSKDVVTWNSMIAGYTHQGLGHEALALYRSMQQEGLSSATPVTFVCLLQACAYVGELRQGQHIHAQIREKNLDTDILIGRGLVNMYSKCGSLDDARKVFDSLPRRDVVAWTCMITGCIQQGLSHEAIALYDSMLQEGITQEDTSILYRVLKMCSEQKDLSLGRKVHALVIKSGQESNTFLANHIIAMYASHGKLEDAMQVFTKASVADAHMWTTIIWAHARNGQPTQAISLYEQMRDWHVEPDNHTFVAVLWACAAAEDLASGQEVHSDVLKSVADVDTFVGNSLVSMYAKCGSLEDARRVFDSLCIKDVVTWNAMFAGYTKHGLGHEALALNESMQQQGDTVPTHATFVCLLKACAAVGALSQGKELHRQIQGRGLEADVPIGSSLVDMYAKCGSLEDAQTVFQHMPSRNVVTWGALLNGYAEHGYGDEAIHCFKEMLQQGVEPDETIFISLLVACSHAGLVHEGLHYFRVMVDEHGIAPSQYHYNCIVDLLGRSGFLDEAEEILLQTAPSDSLVVGWTSLLSACKSQGHAELGQRCFERLVAMEPANASAYVLLGNMYAHAGRWKDVEETERLRNQAGAWKKPARACIEVNRRVHEFTVGEDRADISSKVRGMNKRLKEEGGHVPQTELVLKAVSLLEKEEALCGHAEKLALAYGLLYSPDGSSLLVTKNLRMCNDCHSSTKVMSRLEKREIIVRDAQRVHRFRDGSCSCGDRH